MRHRTVLISTLFTLAAGCARHEAPSGDAELERRVHAVSVIAPALVRPVELRSMGEITTLSQVPFVRRKDTGAPCVAPDTSSCAGPKAAGTDRLAELLVLLPSAPDTEKLAEDLRCRATAAGITVESLEPRPSGPLDAGSPLATHVPGLGLVPVTLWATGDAASLDAFACAVSRQPRLTSIVLVEGAADPAVPGRVRVRYEVHGYVLP